jgi:hypothetical protein
MRITGGRVRPVFDSAASPSVGHLPDTERSSLAMAHKKKAPHFERGAN